MELNYDPYYKNGNDINSGCNELDRNAGMFRLNDYVIEGLVDLYILSKTNVKKENCNMQTNDYKHQLKSTYALYAHSISQL